MNKDYLNFAKDFQLREELRDSTFLITGATGLIGKAFVSCLHALNQTWNLGLKITCPVRDVKKAQDLFTSFTDVTITDMDWDEISKNHYDYIVHGACPTSSRYFITNPVETIKASVGLTESLLEVAKITKPKAMVYLSSLEAYGSIMDDDTKVTEDIQGYINPISVRSSYPMAKRMAETLCCAYSKECGVPVRIARLTQTFGSEVAQDDNRVFAQFARCIANGEDIELHTEGNSSKHYLYVIDAVSALLYILLKGTDGEAYNVANEETYTSVKDLALYLIANFNPQCKLDFHQRDNQGYAPETHLNLSCAKLRSLGWTPKINKRNMFQNLIEGVKINPCPSV